MGFCQKKDLCNFCIIGSLKGPYSHKFYSNRNKSFNGPKALTTKEVIYEDMKEGALQIKKYKKMLTPVGTASISQRIFKARKLKISGANLAFNSQYYKV